MLINNTIRNIIFAGGRGLSSNDKQTKLSLVPGCMVYTRHCFVPGGEKRSLFWNVTVKPLAGLLL